MAIVAAKTAVAVPIMEINERVKGASEYNTLERTTIYIPAVTIVAAWISADTGVGPAMASGSHVYKGVWALLPIAPTKSNNVINVRMVTFFSGACAKTSLKFVVWNVI